MRLNNSLVQFRITKEQRERISKLAEDVGLRTPSYCRLIILKNLQKEEHNE